MSKARNSNLCWAWRFSWLTGRFLLLNNHFFNRSVLKILLILIFILLIMDLTSHVMIWTNTLYRLLRRNRLCKAALWIRLSLALFSHLSLVVWCRYHYLRKRWVTLLADEVLVWFWVLDFILRLRSNAILWCTHFWSHWLLLLKKSLFLSFSSSDFFYLRFHLHSWCQKSI